MHIGEPAEQNRLPSHYCYCVHTNSLQLTDNSEGGLRGAAFGGAGSVGRFGWNWWTVWGVKY